MVAVVADEDDAAQDRDWLRRPGPGCQTTATPPVTSVQGQVRDKRLQAMIVATMKLIRSRCGFHARIPGALLVVLLGADAACDP